MHMDEGAYGERVDVYMNERGNISVCMYVCMNVCMCMIERGNMGTRAST